VLAGSVLVVAARNPEEGGLAAWGWGLVAHGASYPAFALRYLDLADLSVVLSNGLTALTLALHALALRPRSGGRGLRQEAPALGGPVVAAVVLSAALSSLHDLRTVGLTAIFAWQSLDLLRRAWGPESPPRERGRILLLLGSTLLLGLFGFRALAVASTFPWDPVLRIQPDLQSAVYLGSLSVMLLNTMGFVLMQKEQSTLRWLQVAYQDPLTGVANRRRVMAELERGIAFAAREARPFAVLIFDLDHFKRVNDTFGHQAGDEVLRVVTARVSAQLRGQDLLGRFGGEEFLVLLPGTDAAGAVVVGERIRAEVAGSPVRCGDHRVAVTVSIGVCARVPGPEPQQGERMVAEADLALYAAKRGGRDRVELAVDPVA
jgi:diguanylate cyclase (GGDEF)-like protein